MTRDASVAAATRRAAPGSAQRWGSTLRALLIDPGAGFRTLVGATSEPGRRGARAVAAANLLAALGGAGSFLLWLKLSALVGLRVAGATDYRPGYLAAAGALGAFAGVGARALWAGAAAMWLRAPARVLRTVWSAAAVPQLFAVFVLVPLDLVVVGPLAYTSQRIDSAAATAWAAISIALWISLVVWSLLLIVRGAQVAADVRVAPALAAGVASILSLGVVLAAFYGLSVLAPETT